MTQERFNTVMNVAVSGFFGLLVYGICRWADASSLTSLWEAAAFAGGTWVSLR